MSDREALNSSSYFDGKRYHNLDQISSNGVGGVLRWQFAKERNKAAWPRWVENPAHPPPPATILPGAASITLIGHASFLIRLYGKNGSVVSVLTDRVFRVCWERVA